MNPFDRFDSQPSPAPTAKPAQRPSPQAQSAAGGTASAVNQFDQFDKPSPALAAAGDPAAAPAGAFGAAKRHVGDLGTSARAGWHGLRQSVLTAGRDLAAAVAVPLSIATDPIGTLTTGGQRPMNTSGNVRDSIQASADAAGERRQEIRGELSPRAQEQDRETARRYEEEGFLSGLGHQLANPSSIARLVAESGPATGTAILGGRFGTRGVMGATVPMGAGEAMADARDAIMGLSDAEAAAIPDYQAARLEGASHREALERLAETSRGVAGAVGAAAGTIPGMPGINPVEQVLSRQASSQAARGTLARLANTRAGNAVREAVGEVPEEVGITMGANLGQQTAGLDVDTFEGAGQAAGGALLAGSVMGAAIPGRPTPAAAPTPQEIAARQIDDAEQRQHARDQNDPRNQGLRDEQAWQQWQQPAQTADVTMAGEQIGPEFQSAPAGPISRAAGVVPQAPMSVRFPEAAPGSIADAANQLPAETILPMAPAPDPAIDPHQTSAPAAGPATSEAMAAPDLADRLFGDQAEFWRMAQQASRSNDPARVDAARRILGLLESRLSPSDIAELRQRPAPVPGNPGTKQDRAVFPDGGMVSEGNETAFPLSSNEAESNLPAPRIEPLGTKGLLVHGDHAQVRERLAAAGFRKRGRAHPTGGLQFDRKDQGAIERALSEPSFKPVVEQAASDAAASPANDRPEPTPAQREAGNYAKGHVRLNGLDISIENPAGTRRQPEFEPLRHHYGYIRGTKGRDKDHVDVFLGPRAEDASAPVFVIDQVNRNGRFDEHKVMFGFDDEASARAGYLANYPEGWTGLGSITPMTQGQFKAWVRDGKATARPAADTRPAGLTSDPAAAGASTPTEIAQARRAWAEQGTASPWFRRWFGRSKVAREGQPLVVHHGTAADFTVFESGHSGNSTGHMTAALGHFFAENRQSAQRYAENAAEGMPMYERVVDAYLAIQNPATLTAEQFQAIDSTAAARALRARLERQGHDGLHIPEWGQWVAFQSSQIKSATDNRGTFDPENPDINFSLDANTSAGPRASVGRPGAVRRPGLGQQQVHELAVRILGMNPDQGAVPVAVVGTAEQLPQAIRQHMQANGIAAEQVRGVHWRGKSYLVADALPDRKAVSEAIFHEHYTHGGLRAKYGNRLGDKLASLLRGIGGMDGLRKLAREQGIDLSAYEAGNHNLPPRLRDLVLMEELLAHASSATGTLRRTIEEWVGTLREWLRRNNFADLAEYGITDLAYVLRQARIAAQQKVPGSTAGPQYTLAERAPTSAAGPSPGDGAPPMFALDGSRPVATTPFDHLSDEQRQALGKISTFAEREPFSARARRLSDQWKLKLVQGVFDQFRPLKDLDATAYMQARLSKGTDGALETTFRYGPPKLTDGALDVTPDGQGLQGILADLQGEHDLFFAWVAGNRASKLAGEGREHLFSGQEINALLRLNRGQMPDGRRRSDAYAKAHRAFNRYQKAVLDIATEAGLVSAESRAQWESEFYVPFYRVMEADATVGPGDVGGLVGQRAFQRLKGGTEPLGDLLSNTLSNWSHLLSASMKNLAGQRALQAAEQMGVAERVAQPERGSVRVMVDGRPRNYLVNDPLVLDALTMLHHPGWNNPAMKAMQWFKRALTMGVTTSPTFRIRNLIRDTLSAIASNPIGYNPLRNLADGWKGTRQTSETYQRLLGGGGAIRFGSLLDGDQAANAKRLIGTGVKRSQILDTEKKVKNAFAQAWDWYQYIGDRGESVNRAAIYERAREQGKSHLEASYLARDLLDFTMGGKWAAVRFLTQVVPFMNARLQGMYKLGRGAKEDPRRFSAVTGAVALASVLLHLANSDDDDYRALPDWVRDTYWWVRMPGTNHALFIPKPFEVGALGSVAERAAELMTGGDDYQARDFFQTVKGIASDQLALNPVPQAVKPFMEAAFNRDTFRGRAIDSMGQERLPAGERHTAHTSAAAVALGQAVGYSPQRIEHMVRGYFGWLGAQALGVTDLLVRPAMDLPSNPRRDLSRVENWPILGDFAKPTAGGASNKYLGRFYDMQRQLDEFYASYSEARKAGDLGKMMTMAGDKRMQQRRIYSAANKQITRLNQRIRRITNDRRLTAAEKRQLLEGLNDLRNGVAERTDIWARAMGS